MVAAGLASIGITKERVEAVVGRPCGCSKRQESLNRLGRMVGIGGRDDGKETDAESKAPEVPL